MWIRVSYPLPLLSLTPSGWKHMRLSKVKKAASLWMALIPHSLPAHLWSPNSKFSLNLYRVAGGNEASARKDRNWQKLLVRDPQCLFGVILSVLCLTINWFSAAGSRNVHCSSPFIKITGEDSFKPAVTIYWEQCSTNQTWTNKLQALNSDQLLI